jgi:hypothetical protein
MNIQKPTLKWNGPLTPISPSKIDGIALHHAAAIKLSFLECHQEHLNRVENGVRWNGIGYAYYVHGHKRWTATACPGQYFPISSLVSAAAEVPVTPQPQPTELVEISQQIDRLLNQHQLMECLCKGKIEKQFKASPSWRGLFVKNCNLYLIKATGLNPNSV